MAFVIRSQMGLGFVRIDSMGKVATIYTLLSLEAFTRLFRGVREEAMVIGELLFRLIVFAYYF